MTLPLCIVGAGSIGMRHVACARASDAVRLTGIVDPGRADALATLDAVPKDTRAAIVATPTGDHFATAMACLNRGWAVLVEKPLTATLAEARALCDRADTLGLPLLTGHHRRCHPVVAAARDLVARLGDLVAVQGIWSLRKHDAYFDADWRRGAGAGPILTNLSHEVDLLRLLAGEIVQVSAMTAHAARGLAVEDTAVLSFRFAGGALGSFTLSDAGASPWAFEAATGENPAIAVRGPDPLRFIGTRGALEFPSLTLWQGSDWRSPITRTQGPAGRRVDGIAVQLARFAAVAGGHRDDGLATGRDGLATMRVMEAIARAVATGQTQDITQKDDGHET